MFFFRKVYIWLLSRRNPVKAARKLGVSVGYGCSFASMPYFGSEPYLFELGSHVRTSSKVSFITHDGSTWVFRDQEKYKKVLRFAKIKVGNNCFLGFQSTIMPGVTIGDNCIIGAGALVTKDVPAGSVVGGVPAHIISTTEAYAEKCLAEAPNWDEEAMKRDKKSELLRVLK